MLLLPNNFVVGLTAPPVPAPMPFLINFHASYQPFLASDARQFESKNWGLLFFSPFPSRSLTLSLGASASFLLLQSTPNISHPHPLSVYRGFPLQVSLPITFTTTFVALAHVHF